MSRDLEQIAEDQRRLAAGIADLAQQIARRNGAEQKAHVINKLARVASATPKREPVRDTQETRIQLIPFDAIALDDEPEYLIEGLIPAGGITILWGPPKSLKSFLMYDMAMHVALGWEYRGRRVQQATVVYCAFEGQKGVKKRCAAFRNVFLAEDAAPVPFYLQAVRLNLIKEAPALVQAILGQLGDTRPGLIVLDTLNRSLVGSESRDEDMSAYLAAADMLREELGCAVVIVHHCGVDGSRPRGHTSITGTADAQLAVRRVGITAIIKVEWMKDGADGEELASRLEVVEVGVSKRGEVITSCVVRPAELQAETEQAKPLKGNQRTLFGILHEAIPQGLSLAEWNDRAKEAGIGTRRRADLHDLREALKAKHLVMEAGDRWIVKP